MTIPGTHAANLERLALAAQERGGLAERRADGAFFTDPDVAALLARRAIDAWLRDHAGEAPSRERMAELLSNVVVLDPTCGAGSFLVAAWHVLSGLAAELEIDGVTPAQLHGIDRSEEAVAAALEAFRLVAPGLGPPSVERADALSARLPATDILLGNPPYVRASSRDAPPGARTASVPNVSAWIVERALAAARPGARAAFVLPISTSCTDAFAAARADWERRCDLVLTSHFDTIPATLFEGVVQRLSIYEGRLRGASGDDASPARWCTTRYHRWLREERAAMLDGIQHVPLPPQHVNGSIAKVGTAVEARLLERLFRHPPAGRWFARVAEGDAARAGNVVHYKRRWSYFLLFCDFVPGIWDADGTPREPTELKTVAIDPVIDSRVLLAAWSSTLFWWYFSAFTDNRNVNRRDLAAFPLPDLDDGQRARLVVLADRLMDALHACAEVRTCTYRSIGTIRNTYFRQGSTRPVIDEIDRELARAYGMADDELRFVLDFERRFRSG